MEITASILGLTKNNNGFFKSEKQAEFLISQIEKSNGCIGYATSGYHSCPLFAEWDEKGIIRIVKHSKTKTGCKDIVTFERKVKGILNDLQVKEITTLKRKINSLEKELNEKVASFNNGSYNNSGDTSTYTDYMIELYNRSCERIQLQINSINELITEKES